MSFRHENFLKHGRIWILLLLAAPAELAKAQNDSPEEERPIACVETDTIASYKVENDSLVRLAMTDKSQILMRLKRHCPQLYFHRYISYTPVNGRLCAKVDDIRTRAGLSCRIGSFEKVSEAKQAKSDGAAAASATAQDQK